MTKAKPADYESLKKIWYSKLKKSGFEDIENSKGHIKTMPSSKYNSKEFINKFNAKRYYYELADHFLYNYDFENSLDQVIWGYHASGLTVREISDTLKKVKSRCNSKTSVHKIISKLKNIMIKKYVKT